MNADINQLLVIFDGLLTSQDELYALRTIHNNGLSITLTFSTTHSQVSVSVSNNANLRFIHLKMENCSAIRVVNEEKKHLEIIHKIPNQGRCFISLSEDYFFKYEITE